MDKDNVMDNEESKRDDFAKDGFGDIIDELHPQDEQVTYDVHDQKRREIAQKITRTS